MVKDFSRESVILDDNYRLECVCIKSNWWGLVVSKFSVFYSLPPSEQVGEMVCRGQLLESPFYYV